MSRAPAWWIGLWLAASTSGQIRFVDVAAEAGVNFTLDNHPTPDKHMIETMTGGVAAFDYNGDGRLDVFFANGAEIPSLEKSSPRYFNRLFRNDGDWRFSDVTGEAGLSGEGYSMGASAGDFDNDGDVDLFVVGVFRNKLYRNRGDGTFEDLTAQSGVKSDRWSVAAGWFDYDKDGLLDLFVVNYADWGLDYDRFCGDRDKGVRVYCHPKYFKPIANQLYRNLGEGRFEDVSVASGVAAAEGRGMSVVFADYDGDGWIDAFVTNDNLPNFLFRNNGDGTFSEEALLAGVALLQHGKPVASMGADFQDYDNDRLPDIVVTALSGETYPLFRNEGGGFFLDATHSSGLAKASARTAGWGVGFGDFDNDGRKDLFAANSHVNDLVEMFEDYVYKQRNTLFVNRGDGTFSTGFEFPGARAHRGSAIADFDGDGRLDVVVSALGEPAELWRNETEDAGAWIAIRLEGRASNRDGLGACVQVGEQRNCLIGSVGYASSSLGPAHFGLGEAAVAADVEILWPSGRKQTLRSPAVNRVHSAVEPLP